MSHTDHRRPAKRPEHSDTAPQHQPRPEPRRQSTPKAAVQAALLEEIDLDVIEALDFDPVCSMTSGRGAVECPNEARWAATFRKHCSPDTATALLCDGHYTWVMAGGVGRCNACGDAAVLRPFLLRLERIKP